MKNNQTGFTHIFLFVFVVVCFAIVGGYLIVAGRADSPIPTNSAEIVLRYSNLSGSQSYRSDDGSTVNLISPNDTIVTADGTLLCNTGDQNGTTQATLSKGELKQLFDEANTSEFDKAAKEQRGNLPDITTTNYDTLASFTLSSTDGDKVIYNKNDSSLFERTTKKLQQKCKSVQGKHVQSLPPLAFGDAPSSNRVVAWFNNALLPKASAAGDSRPASNDDFSRINVHRSNHFSLQPLDLRYCMNQVAIDWSAHMAKTQTLAHNPNYGRQIENNCGKNLRSWGENVGYGPSESLIFQALLNSCGHHVNIDGRPVSISGNKCSSYYQNYKYVGISVYDDGNGRVWLTQDFANW